MTRFAIAGLVPAVILLSGCGGNYNDGLNLGGELSGTVTINGTPLLGGRVECFADNGKYSVAAELDKSGKYTLKEPPLGPCKLVVKTAYLKDHPAAPLGGKAGGKNNPVGSAGMVLPENVGLGFTPIPEKYESLATTDITVTVERGNHTHDIKLTR